MVKKIETKTEYRAADGRTFSDEASAAKHEELVELRNNFKCARDDLGKAFAATHKTADGHSFQFGIWGDYYWITPGFFSLPSLQSVSFWGNNWDWRSSDDETGDDFVLISYVENKYGRGGESRDFKIQDLYRDKKNAEAALNVVQIEWLEARKKEIKGDE